MGPEAPDLTATGADAHTGLLVYNVNQCIPDKNPIGLYVWDGTKWEFVGDDSPSPEVSYFEDTRPQALGTQTYPYRTFGAAGTWMLENMRYLPTDGSIKQSLGDTNKTSKYYAYPNQKTVNTIPTTWSKAQGLLYTYSAATLGTQDTAGVNQGVQNTTSTPGANEVENTGPLGIAPNKYVQGICPPGWRIPSDRDINLLEEELYNNALQYSSYPDKSGWTPNTWNSAWNSAWNSLIGFRPGNGHVFVITSYCPVSGSSNPTYGKSLPRRKGGFDLMPVGTAWNGASSIYGTHSELWSASVNGTDSAFARELRINNNPQINRKVMFQYIMLSVRCKKN